MAFATPKRVTFNKEVTKLSIGSATPTITRLSQIENKNRDSISSVSSKINNVQKNIAANNNSDNTKNSENAITVAIRVRPLSEKEKTEKFHNCILVDESNKELTLCDRQNNKKYQFKSDFIITDQTIKSNNIEENIIDSQQQYVYESIAKPLLEKSFEGYNVSIFAYGQTGSGKTYSMIGNKTHPGLIPRLFDDLFVKKSDRDKIVTSTRLEISYYEIYNEKIYDLLLSDNNKSSTTNISNNKSNNLPINASNNKHLQIREDPRTGPYIVNLSTLGANSVEDAKLWLDLGNNRRVTACTNMNKNSSRSHTVLQINLTQILKHECEQNDENSEVLPAKNSSKTQSEYLQVFSSRINLIDLAGSERLNSAFGSNTNFVSNSTNGTNSTRFKESTCINKSLLTLGKIISLLSERQQSASNINASNLAAINGHLPYRDSVLTWLLKDSLGGNAKTAMLATVNASSQYLDETLCTLRYAAQASSIKNAVEMNHSFRQKYINEFGEITEIPLALPPLKHFSETNQQQLEMTLKQMEKEWKEKLDEAERLKQKEIKDLEKSLIVLYENETKAQNCCLINLNEDPSLSEKLIYLLKSNTTIGSDKNEVNIQLTGPLIGPVHCKIWLKPENNNDYFIENLDKNYLTFLNGEIIETNKHYQLNHGDRIIFGGSHYFRFNNPTSSKSVNAASTNKTNLFKDYEFAKNEMVKKQDEIIQRRINEELNKQKKDDDIRLNELKLKYEQNLDKIKSDLEKEKELRKQEIEQIKLESTKKIKQFQKKLLIESKITDIQNDQAKIINECDSLLKTPNNNINNKNLINKLLLSESCKNKDQSDEIIQSHASSNSLFAISLCVTEANKICTILGFDYEFKRYELRGDRHVQLIQVIDKKLKQVTLWSLETFEFKLNMLRDIYSKYLEENNNLTSNDISTTSSTCSTDSQMVTDSMDEWQTLEDFEKNDETFFQRIIENAIGSENKETFSPSSSTSKRRLSILSASTNNLTSQTSQTILFPIGLSKSIDNLSFKNTDQIDNKLKLNSQQTPQIKMRTPLISSSCLNLKTKSYDLCSSSQNLNNNLNIGNSLLFATCRDALNDELQIEDDNYDDDDEIGQDEEDDDIKFECNGSQKQLANNDDLYLKSYARLVYTINKLVQLNENNEMTTTLNSMNNLNQSLNKPLYCMKIFQYFIELNQFKPNYLLVQLTNPDSLNEIKKLYRKIRKSLNLIKDYIKCIFQSVENNLDTMTKSKHEQLVIQLTKLFHMHGEYILLSCSNTFLNRGSYCLSLIDNKFMIEYVRGAERQFDEFLINKKLYLQQHQINIKLFKFIELIQKFCTYKSKSTINTQTNIDSLIDYSNYLFQTHYRLTSAFKLILNLKKLNEQTKMIEKINAQLIEYSYNILTDTLAIISDTFQDEDDNNKKSKDESFTSKYWNDSFIDAFKEIKLDLTNKPK